MPMRSFANADTFLMSGGGSAGVQTVATFIPPPSEPAAPSPAAGCCLRAAAAAGAGEWEGEARGEKESQEWASGANGSDTVRDGGTRLSDAGGAGSADNVTELTTRQMRRVPSVYPTNVSLDAEGAKLFAEIKCESEQLQRHIDVAAMHEEGKQASIACSKRNAEMFMRFAYSTQPCFIHVDILAVSGHLHAIVMFYDIPSLK